MDIIIFAVVAGLIFYRYMSILGTKNEEDDRRTMQTQTVAEVIVFPGKHNDEAILNQKPTLEETLDLISRKDADFSPEDFLEGAIKVFEMTVHCFDEKNMSKVERFLSPQVLSQFEKAIQDRADGVSLKLEKIQSADILEAFLTGNVSEITVRFLSLQTLTMNGKIEGTEEVSDLWSFSKGLNKNEGYWTLINITPAEEETLQN